METNLHDKRRHPRRAMTVCSWLEFRGDTSARGMRSIDFSHEGARFASIKPVVTGERVMLRLELFTGAPAIECKGRVCWVRPMESRLRHFGVRFVDLDPEEQELIEQALTPETPKPGSFALI
jgi:Tfp pilus assembly protein PilZ